jgi:hypothetical protein
MVRNRIGTTFGQASCDASMDIPGGNHCNLAIWSFYFRPHWGTFSVVFSNNAQLATYSLLAGYSNWI